MPRTPRRLFAPFDARRKGLAFLLLFIASLSLALVLLPPNTSASKTRRVSPGVGNFIPAVGNFIPGGASVAPVLTLGNYPNKTVVLGANTTVTPDAAPSGATSINVSTSTNFEGTLVADPSTGVVKVTNASTSGIYTVTVRAFSGATSVTKTFTLTVQAGTACTGAPTFPSGPDVTVGSAPRSVAVGDFNGDGKQDLAVANYASASVSILLGNGAGSFSSAPDISVGNNPTSIAVGDFNGDGKQDLAIANENSNTLSIRLGDGAGNFSGTTNVNLGRFPESVAVGDFNGDGKQDFAVAIAGANSVSILLGDGAGGFSAPSDVVVGTTPFSVVVGDFNGDGKQDFAAANYNSNTLSIRLGDGAGAFNSAPDVNAGTNPQSIALGDFNGDGKQDLAAANNNSNSVSIRLGDGTGKFTGTTNLTMGGYPISVAVGDFNSDGKQDLAVGHSNSSLVSIMSGDGAGNFSSSTNVSVGSFFVTLGDFNGDGKQDLATVDSSHTLSVRLEGCNAAPTISATAGLSRQQASAAVNSQIASVTDDGGDANVTVKVNDSTSATVNGVTVSNIVNTNGNITADIAAACGASNAGFTLQASDGASTTNATLNITVTANSAPVLTYANPSAVAFNGSATLTPSTASDNGSITGYAVQSVTPALTNAPTVDASGVVSITGAQPAGIHTVTIRATDNCGTTTDATFNLTVNKADTTTALTSSANPSFLNQTVTFTATVSPIPSSAGTPNGTVNFKDGGTTITNCGAVALSSGQATCTTNTLSLGNHTITADYSGAANFSASTATLSGGETVNGGFEFSQDTFTVGERDGSVTITVRRTGDTSLAASVDYSTDDGSTPSVAVPCSSVTGVALERCDYTRAAGTLNFAAGDTQKTFAVLVNDDSYTEGTEVTHLRLSNPVGAQLAPQSSAALQITDDTQQTINPVDDASFFVRQHYHDFLNREPDDSGLQFWTNGITTCGSDTNCVAVKRVDTSAAFFLSIEFQETGYLVERIYKTAYGDATGSSTFPSAHTLPVPVVRLNEFLLDTQRIGRNVIVGVGDWPQQLEANKQAFALEFVSRQRFISAFPSSLTAEQFVGQLDQNAGGVLSADEKAQLISSLSATPADPSKRASALRAVAENSTLKTNESNRAFVLMQFFGYLRRNPNDAQDTDYTGYDFWLTKLNQFNGNFVQAEMVKAFITSDEYRHRFGQ